MIDPHTPFALRLLAKQLGIETTDDRHARIADLARYAGSPYRSAPDLPDDVVEALKHEAMAYIQRMRPTFLTEQQVTQAIALAAWVPVGDVALTVDREKFEVHARLPRSEVPEDELCRRLGFLQCGMPATTVLRAWVGDRELRVPPRSDANAAWNHLMQAVP